MEQDQKRRGRPGVYESAAARAKAWRQRRQEALDAAAQVLASPPVVERVVEVERLIPVPTRASRKAPVPKLPSASHLFPLLKGRFDRYGGEDAAKRFRTNAARAATAARDVLALAQQGGAVPQVEEEFLRQVSAFFEQLNGAFEVAQKGAKKAAAKVEAEYKARHEAEVQAMVLKTFGPVPDTAEVQDMAESLLAFDKAANDWLQRKYRVDRGYVSIDREFEIRYAVKQKDVKALARELAEVRIAIREIGTRWTDGDETGRSAGWSDFEEYRANEMARGEAIG